MSPASFDNRGFIRAMLDRGWQWSGPTPDRLVHPTNHAFYLRYDADADRLTVSPELNAHLDLVIPSPRPKRVKH